MIEGILEILVDFGFIQADYKHRKEVIAKEKKDGIKRPFEKYFWSPSVRVSVLLIGLIFLLLFLFSSYQNKIMHPKNTKQEIVEISNYIEEWKTKFKKLPQELNEIIHGRPLRQTWLLDAWNRPYQYTVDKDKKSFSIKSAGADGKFNTTDDIKLE